MAALLAELRGDDRVTRIRAAGALRPVVAQAPDAVRPAVLERVRVETDGVVLMRLIWSCHPYLAGHVREVVAAIASGAAGRWADAGPTGAALAILGGCVPARTRRGRGSPADPAEPADGGRRTSGRGSALPKCRIRR